MRWYNYRWVNGLIVLASLVGMSFVLYLEHVKGLDPCPLCIFQRLGLMGMGFFALIAFLHHPLSKGLRRFYGGLSTLAILWSFGVAIRHIWLQNLPPTQVPSCGPGLNYLVEALPLRSVLSEVLSGSGECAVIDWTFLGFSLPVWSLLFFTILLILCLWQTLRRYPDLQTKI